MSVCAMVNKYISNSMNPFMWEFEAQSAVSVSVCCQVIVNKCISNVLNPFMWEFEAESAVSVSVCNTVSNSQ